MFFLRASAIPVFEEYRVSSKSSPVKGISQNRKSGSLAETMERIRTQRTRENKCKLPKTRQVKGESDLLRESMAAVGTKKESNGAQREGVLGSLVDDQEQGEGETL